MSKNIVSWLVIWFRLSCFQTSAHSF